MFGDERIGAKQSQFAPEGSLRKAEDGQSSCEGERERELSGWEGREGEDRAR